MAKAFAKAFYNSKEWASTRAYILKRDGYHCTEPGCPFPATEVHHIIELTQENIGDPAITMGEDNLRSLCHECHQRITKQMKQCEQKGNVLVPIGFDDDGYPYEI